MPKGMDLYNILDALGLGVIGPIYNLQLNPLRSRTLNTPLIELYNIRYFINPKNTPRYNLITGKHFQDLG